MRTVAVEPFLSPAAEKADEWLPIRPGSEGALACALLNLLLNEYRLFDAEHIRRHTDGPYLVRPDGAYARDAASGKPLVWDAATGRARPFDEDCADVAIEGMYSVEGEDCRPVFQLLREAVRHWTPEAAARGHHHPRRDHPPHRPRVRRGGPHRRHRHDRGPGAAPATGGGRRWPRQRVARRPGHRAPERGGRREGRAGRPPGQATASWPPRDGLLEAGLVPERDFIGAALRLRLPAGGAHRLRLEPADERGRGRSAAWKRSRTASWSPSASTRTRPPRPWPTSSCPTPATWSASTSRVTGRRPAMGDWACQLGQPAVPPLFERRPFSEVLLEIGERLGIAGAMNDAAQPPLRPAPPHALEPEERCSWEEMVDRVCQGWFGPEHGLAWFRQNGVLAWPKRVEEAYPKPFGRGPRCRLSYDAAPRLAPTEARQPQIGFDLQAVSYRVPWHASLHLPEPLAGRGVPERALQLLHLPEPAHRRRQGRRRRRRHLGGVDGRSSRARSRPPERGRSSGGGGHRRQRRSLGARHARRARARASSSTPS